MKEFVSKIMKFVKKNYMIIVFLISGAGFFGSMFYSNVLDLSPCVLCWYQRILCYPIFFLSAASIALKEKLSPRFILTLAIPGLIIAGYHFGIQKLGFEADLVTCIAGNPCASVDIEYLGFITIPLMSFAAFLVITIASYIKLRKTQED